MCCDNLKEFFFIPSFFSFFFFFKVKQLNYAKLKYVRPSAFICHYSKNYGSLTRAANMADSISFMERVCTLNPYLLKPGFCL